jgi:N-6 DNA Methylase
MPWPTWPADLANAELLDATRALAFTIERTTRRAVDYKNLGSEELGSIYESLLELHPELNTAAGSFELKTAAGHERKTTGSYYTPASLVSCLLDSALDPVLAEAARQPDPEAAILRLKVCDPAAGSGHFLIAAAHRIAKRLAAARTGDQEPSPEQVRKAIRDVIGHCLYGVDINPDAVELCKVALWMEALVPGKPLSFLDHHIHQGNSLLGATPALLKRGIPDMAFEPIEGDDKAVCRDYRKQNRDERGRQTTMFDLFAKSDIIRLSNIAPALARIETMDDDSIEALHGKEHAYREFKASMPYAFARVLADAWCAAFVIPKVFVPPLEPRVTLTESTFRKLENNPNVVPHEVKDEIARLAARYHFFHWHLAFLNVFQPKPGEEIGDEEILGWNGGFDVVLGNPPWDSMSPDAKEFFSAFEPDVRTQDHRGGQRQIIQRLLEDPGIALAWDTYCRDLYIHAHFLKNSGRFRLFAPGDLGKGDLNVYRMFVESALQISRVGGWASQVVPEGFYNGANSMAIRKELFDRFELKRILGFENQREAWFQGIDSRAKFCIYNALKGTRTNEFQVSFNIRSLERLSCVLRGEYLTISARLVENFSSDALAIMELGNQREIDIAAKMYKMCPKFGDLTAGPPHRFYMREIDKETDRGVFDDNPSGPPYYEGRMVSQYDYRAKGYRSGRGRAACWDLLSFDDLGKSIQPQWYIPNEKVPKSRIERIKHYRIGFCDVGSPTNERTLVAALIPPGCVSAHTLPTITFHSTPLDDYQPEDRYEWAYLVWLAIANSFVLDFLMRLKVSLHLSYTILDSMPFPRFELDDSLVRKLLPLSLRLTCTGPEMTAFWNKMAKLGHGNPIPLGTTPPGFVNPGARLNARAEIDAIVAKEIFDLSRDEVEYILETFPIVKGSDIECYGDYRTKSLVLKYYDGFVTAPGVPEQTKGVSDGETIRDLRSLQVALIASYIVLLLREWKKPATRNSLEVGLVLMLNDQARAQIAARPVVPTKKSSSNALPQFVHGLDGLLDQLQTTGFIRVQTTKHRQVIRLGPNAPDTAGAPAEDIARVRDTLDAFRIVGEDRASVVVPLLVTERYELVS